METFEPLSDSDTKHLLMRSSNTLCELDPIPTWLVKKRQAEINKVIGNIVSISINTGIFPQSRKGALLTNIFTYIYIYIYICML